MVNKSQPIRLGYSEGMLRTGGRLRSRLLALVLLWAAALLTVLAWS